MAKKSKADSKRSEISREQARKEAQQEIAQYEGLYIEEEEILREVQKQSERLEEQEKKEQDTANDADMVICEMQRQEKKNKSMAERVELWDQKKCLDHFFRVNGEEDTHCIWNRLIKKEILEDFSFIEGKMNEDVHACYCFAVRCKKAVYTNAPYYHYTFNVNGVTNNSFTVKKMDLLYVWDKVRGLVANEVPEYLQVCDRNIERARFTLLAKMYFDGYDKNCVELKNIKIKLKKSVRENYWKLIRWRMPFNRKVLLTVLNFLT